jgi:hypothetical protein
VREYRTILDSLPAPRPYLGNHLTAIDAAGTATDAMFALDALGRFRTRTVNGTTDTYSCVGTSETVTRAHPGESRNEPPCSRGQISPIPVMCFRGRSIYARTVDRWSCCRRGRDRT